MSPEDKARKAIREVIWSLYDQGVDMGQIACLVLDETISCYNGTNAIRRVIDEQME